MCEKCQYQTYKGRCGNSESNNYKNICPGIEFGADVRECEFSSIPPCEENSCQKCEGAPHARKQ